jgi:putative phage-type endonuclease
MSDVIQGTAEWKALRAGKVTASRIADMMAKTKSGYGASRANYAAQLVAERLTGEIAESYTNGAMQWGTDHEAEARTAYDWRSDALVTEVGFVEHPTIAMSGASPDGLVGNDGMVEIKAPLTSTHIDTLLSQSIPNKYVLQMHWQMSCCQRAWVDFCSYDPRLPESMRLFVKRVHRDDKLIAELENEVRTFLSEVDDTVKKLLSIYGGSSAIAA